MTAVARVYNPRLLLIMWNELVLAGESGRFLAGCYSVIDQPMSPNIAVLGLLWPYWSLQACLTVKLLLLALSLEQLAARAPSCCVCCCCCSCCICCFRAACIVAAAAAAGTICCCAIAGACGVCLPWLLLLLLLLPALLQRW